MFPWEEFFKPYMNMPAMGPAREHQERWQELMGTWLNMLNSSISFASEFPQFGKVASSEFPQFMNNFMEQDKKSLTFMQAFNQYLKYMDSCWEKVMRTEDYAKKSADFMSQYIAFRKAMDTIMEGYTQFSPFASKQNIEDISKTLENLDKRISKLEKKLEESEQN